MIRALTIALALCWACESPPSRRIPDAAVPLPEPDAPPADAAPPDAPPADASNACTFPDDCDDGDPCTADICDPWIGCVNEPVPDCGTADAPPR